MKREGIRPVLAISASLLLLAVLHAIVSVESHPSHVVHVILRGLYLFPIVAGAIWFGFAGGLLAAIGVSASYLAHILVSWRGQTMENANQFAMIGVYLAVGSVSGLLVRAREREHVLRIAGERRAERSALIEGLASLVAALGFRDDYTRRHCERVSRLAVAIGTRFDLSAERLEALRLAALTHDIGKIGVPDDILYKPEALDAAERARIERHPQIASEILRRIHGAREIAEIVLCHHECPDGSGYPRGLRGDQIPLNARILRVADVYSALTDERSYKPGLGPREALDLMEEWGEAKLDGESLRVLQSWVEAEDAERPDDLETVWSGGRKYGET
jgi:putative nucleotidyltransferase with HDIG domain